GVHEDRMLEKVCGRILEHVIVGPIGLQRTERAGSADGGTAGSSGSGTSRGNACRTTPNSTSYSCHSWSAAGTPASRFRDRTCLGQYRCERHSQWLWHVAREPRPR